MLNAQPVSPVPLATPTVSGMSFALSMLHPKLAILPDSKLNLFTLHHTALQIDVFPVANPQNLKPNTPCNIAKPSLSFSLEDFQSHSKKERRVDQVGGFHTFLREFSGGMKGTKKSQNKR